MTTTTPPPIPARKAIPGLPPCTPIQPSQARIHSRTERSILYRVPSGIIKVYVRDPPTTMREPHLHLHAHRAGIAPRPLCASAEGTRLAAIGFEDAGNSLDRHPDPPRLLHEATSLLARAHSALAGTPPCPDRQAETTRLGEWLGNSTRLARAAGVPGAVLEAASRAARLGVPGLEVTVHGDPHLGQFLHGNQGLLLVDWEGEPGRPARLLCSRTSRLRDLAVLARSLDYYYALRGLARRDPQSVGLELLEAYGLPGRLLEALLAWMVDRALYEAWYEERYGTGLAWVPLSGLGVLVEVLGFGVG